MKTVLDCRGLKKTFGNHKNVKTVLDHIDLSIDEGEFVGIMGPSGSGKSTLLNVLSTIDTPTAGTIYIDNKKLNLLTGEDISNFRRDHLGFIFQDYQLLDTLSVSENIALPIAFTNESAKEILEKVKKVARLFGIHDILDKYPYEISGGQQQRTAAARAIINNPSILFADEPTGALDSKSSYQLLQTLSQLNTREKATILMVTHDPYAASFCSRILFIKDGSIFTEIRKGEKARNQLFQQILDILATLGGGSFEPLQHS